MVGSTGTTRSGRSSTLPAAPSEHDAKKHGQARHYGISHRSHASHSSSNHRHLARDGAHQLGAELVNLLNPRSATSSAVPSRSASRHPQGEESSAGLARTASARVSASPTSSSRKPTMTWQDVRELRHNSQEAERRLRSDLEDLSSLALSSSRKSDALLLKIQANLNSSANELFQLKELAQSTTVALARFSEESLPDVESQHRIQIQSLRKTYEAIETERIGDLEKRLKVAVEKIAAIKQRMTKVRSDVGYWEMRDAEELKRSRRRHGLFYSLAAVVFAILLAVFWPRTQQSTTEEVIADIAIINKTDFTTFGDGKRVMQETTSERLKPPSKPPDWEDPRLRIFDDL